MSAGRVLVSGGPGSRAAAGAAGGTGGARIFHSQDGGKTWSVTAGKTAAASTPPCDHSPAIDYVAERKVWIAVGAAGSDISNDGGKTWKQFDSAPYNALSFSGGETGWAVGPNGAIAKFSSSPPQP